MSEITANHWKEFITRIILFTLAIIAYIIKIEDLSTAVHILIFLYFQFKMIKRMFPQKLESMGSQKIFKRNFLPANKKVKKENKTIVITAIVWVVFNLIPGILYLTDTINGELMFLISIFYSVCDLICILFWCPFQKLIMKNKCCNTCRIYNWDFLMMFTPLIFVPSIYNYSLVFTSLVVFIIWEYNYSKNYERFYEETNESLKCANCKEYMCKNKLRFVNCKEIKSKIIKKTKKKKNGECL